MSAASNDPEKDYLIDNTEVSSFGFGRRPERRTSISNDQNSKLPHVDKEKKKNII